MKVLVFGKTGQVARELLNQGDVTALGREDADLSVAGACAKQINDRAPDCVINAAAYTAVDRAEDDEDQATRINGNAPTEMAQACAKLGIPFVHISTDYVFEGTGERPWQPMDNPKPLGAYGRSKLAGEIGIRESNCIHTILRTSWVFSAYGGNFLKTMLRLAETRDALTIVADQIGGPTPADSIAAACLSIADQLTKDPSKAGTYHFSGTPDASWADFAREIFRQSEKTVDVQDIPTSAYPTPAQRPLNSRLDCSSTRKAFDIERPDWAEGIGRALAKLRDLEMKGIK